MQVTISAYAGWHGVHLAQELSKRGALQKFASLIRPGTLTGIPRKAIAYPLRVAIPVALGRRLETYTGYRIPQRYIRSVTYSYDAWSARLLNEKTDIAVGWVPFSEAFLTEASRRKITTVVDLGSCHYSEVDRLMDEEFERAGHRYPTGLVDAWCERHLQLADFLVVASEFARKSYLKAGIDSRRLYKIPYGVDVDTFTPAKPQDTVFRIMFAGALSLRKGVRYLLQAFHELDLPNSELVLLGEVEREVIPFLETFSNPAIHVIPSVAPGKEMAAWYQKCSVFVLPSIEEGMARVQLEAMASGLPLICTPNTGGEDLVSDGVDGFAIPIRDVDAMKERILRLYQNPDLRRTMGDKARRKIIENFTWSHYGDRMLDAYAQMRQSNSAK